MVNFPWEQLVQFFDNKMQIRGFKSVKTFILKIEIQYILFGHPLLKQFIDYLEKNKSLAASPDADQASCF